MAPRVSILLPTHNRADVLGYAIRSVLWQTERDFELLIVGDGCTDGTAGVVAGFDDPRIRWFDLPKAPFSGYANRNIALREARGRLIAYAQHDDILFPDHLERLLGAIDASGDDWGYSRPLWVGRDGFVVPFMIDLADAGQLDQFLNRQNLIPSVCVGHSREALERVGYWPEDVERVADWRCWRNIVASSRSGRVAHCRTPTSLHFQAIWREGSTSPERNLRAIAEQGGWWPDACRIPVADGQTEQQAAFEAMAADPAAWVGRMRLAADHIADRLAWAWALPATQTWHVSPQPQAPPRPPDVNKTGETEAKLRRALRKARAQKGALRRRWNSRRALARRLVSLLFGRSGTGHGRGRLRSGTGARTGGRD